MKGNPFFYCVRRFNPLVLARAIFCILFFFIHIATPFLARGGEVKEKKINTAATPSSAAAKNPCGCGSSRVYIHSYFHFFFFLFIKHYIYIYVYSPPGGNKQKKPVASPLRGSVLIAPSTERRGRFPGFN